MGRKWENIKRTKGKLDSARSAVFVRMSREIIVAARQGGGDPAGNFRLRQAIDRAKASGVPNDNIARAIKKGTGDDAADQLDEITYEGYGPGGVAVMVEAMTDNRNRTAGEVRAAFNKAGGNLGETGSVNFMFKNEGQVVVDNASGQYTEDDLLLAAADAGAEDIRSEDETVVIICAPEAVDAVQQALSAAGFPVSSAEAALVPLNTVEVSDRDVAKKLLKLMDALDDLEDVQHVTANFDISDELAEELAAAPPLH